MNSSNMSKLSNLQFVKLNPKKAIKEIKKVLDTHLNMNLSPKNVYSVDFLERKFIFALNSKYTDGKLLKSILSVKGIIGIILSYDSASDGYLSDKIVISEPLSSKEISIKIINHRGRILYSGIGTVKKSEIDFMIRGESSEGRVRTTIRGTIGSSDITFKESTMPNKIYKKRQQPLPEFQK